MLGCKGICFLVVGLPELCSWHVCTQVYVLSHSLELVIVLELSNEKGENKHRERGTRFFCGAGTKNEARTWSKQGEQSERAREGGLLSVSALFWVCAWKGETKKNSAPFVCHDDQGRGRRDRPVVFLHGCCWCCSCLFVCLSWLGFFCWSACLFLCLVCIVLRMQIGRWFLVYLFVCLGLLMFGGVGLSECKPLSLSLSVQISSFVTSASSFLVVLFCRVNFVRALCRVSWILKNARSFFFSSPEICIPY